MQKLWPFLAALLIATSAPARGASFVQFPQGAASVTVPIARGDVLIFARLTINDRDAGWFILDTGAGSDIIDVGVARKLGLKAIGRSVVGGAAGKKAEATIFGPTSIRIDKANFRPHALVGIDLAHLTKDRGLKTSGLIGFDVFGAGPFTIDYARQTLTLHDPRQFKPPQDAKEFPLQIESPRLNTTIQVDGRFEGKVMIDTGYEGGVMLDGGYLRRNYDLFRGRQFVSSGALGVGNQPVGARYDLVKSVRLFGSTVANVSADFPPEPIEPDPKAYFSRMGIMGGLLLRHFRLTFDYASGRAWVKWQGDDELPVPRPAGFDINARDLLGMTALCRAARWGNTDFALALLAAGADPRIGELSTRAPLHMAVERGDTRLVAALLKRGVDPECATADGTTPLMIAAQAGHADLCRALLAAGARPETQAKNGTTSLILAATFGCDDVVATLLQKDASRLVRQEANDGLTPLMAAALGGHVASTKILLDGGSDPKVVAKSDGWTALMCAAQSNQGELIDLLLARGADPAVRDHNGRTALEIARALGRSEAAKRLENPGHDGLPPGRASIKK